MHITSAELQNQTITSDKIEILGDFFPDYKLEACLTNQVQSKLKALLSRVYAVMSSIMCA